MFEQISHFIDVMFLPSVSLGLVLGVAWRCVDTGRSRKLLQSAASILFFLPQPFVIYFGTYSSGLRVYQQVLLALWGVGIGTLMTVQLVAGSRLARVISQIALAVGATAMLFLGVYCGRNIIGDYLLQPDMVRGTVDGVISNTGPGPRSFQVIINHKVYNITFDLLKQISNGDQVDIEVGVASNTVLSVHRRPG